MLCFSLVGAIDDESASVDAERQLTGATGKLARLIRKIQNASGSERVRTGTGPAMS